jgi:hypothetical protein
MANPDATRPHGILVANQYQVDPNRKLPPVGGLAAFGAIDRLTGRTDLMAIQLSRRWPPRARASGAGGTDRGLADASRSRSRWERLLHDLCGTTGAKCAEPIAPLA